MKKLIRAVMLALMLGAWSPLARAADAESKHLGESGLFDLSFSGGTPQKLVSEMQKAGGLKVNVLIPQELTDASIPAMELRSVSVESVFDSLNLLGRNSTRPTMWTRSKDPGNIWVLARFPDNRKTQAFYVGHLLQKFKIDDITTAVQTTWQLSVEKANAELKYHQETQLLIALGPQEKLTTMSNALAQLELAIPRARGFGPAAHPAQSDGTQRPDDKKGKSAAQP